MELLKLDVERSGLIKDFVPYKEGKCRDEVYVEILLYGLEQATITILNGLYAEAYGGNKSVAVLATSKEIRFTVDINPTGYPNSKDIFKVLEICESTLKLAGYSYVLANTEYSNTVDKIRKKVISGEFAYL